MEGSTDGEEGAGRGREVGDGAAGVVSSVRVAQRHLDGAAEGHAADDDEAGDEDLVRVADV